MLICVLNILVCRYVNMIHMLITEIIGLLICEYVNSDFVIREASTGHATAGEYLGKQVPYGSVRWREISRKASSVWQSPLERNDL